MNQWEHLSQVPEKVRHTMSLVSVPWSKQDLSVETVIDSLIQSPRVTQQACRSLQESANLIRVPDLCRHLKVAHPELSWRDTFKAVALFCGLHHKHVQRLFYGERRSHG